MRTSFVTPFKSGAETFWSGQALEQNLRLEGLQESAMEKIRACRDELNQAEIDRSDG